MISSLSRLAALGPPSNVTLAPAGSDLDVVVTDPLTSNNTSMREHVPNLYYHVQYWERQADGQVGSPTHFSITFSPRVCVCVCLFSPPQDVSVENRCISCVNLAVLPAVLPASWLQLSSELKTGLMRKKQVTAARPKISRARDERVDDEG